MMNTTTNTSTMNLPAKLTLAEIQPIVRYRTTVTTYQMLRSKNVKPVSYRPQPGRGGPIGEYDTKEVLEAFRNRLATLRRQEVQENS